MSAELDDVAAAAVRRAHLLSRLRTAALTALVVVLAYIALAFPDLFLLVAVVGQFVWLVIVYAQRDEVAAKWGEAVFAARSAEHRAEVMEKRARLATGAYDAVVKRLAEVLDEHALCPAPVRVTGPACPACEGWNPVSGVRTRETAGLVCQTCGWDYAKGEKPRRSLRAVASGPVPQQRDGSAS